jgi:hypothetical protein
MAYGDRILTQIYGRRLGLQPMTSAVTGSLSSTRTPEFLVGAEDIRKEVTTGDTTGVSLKPFGFSNLSTGLVTGTDATSVFRLDPPIPGVEKTITWLSTTIGTMATKIWVTNSTGGGAGFQTSGGSSFTCVASSAGAVLRLAGLTTALWAVINGTTASGFSFSTTT